MAIETKQEVIQNINITDKNNNQSKDIINLIWWETKSKPQK